MIHRSPEWLSAVRSLGVCVLCGRPGVQAAHRNEGKGVGVKADDAAAAALCPDHHRELDQGRWMTQELRRALMDRAIVLTVIELARRGLIVPATERQQRAPRRQAARPSKGRTASPSKILKHPGRPV